VISTRGAAFRAVTALAVVLFAVLAFGSPAEAIGPDCKDAPPAGAPGNPVGGDPAQKATGKDAFARNSDTTVYREYGLTVPTWSTYDLGCGLDMTRDPIAVVSTFFANGALAVPTLVFGTTMSALAHAVLGWTALDKVDEALAGLSANLRDAVWSDAVALVGILVLLWWLAELMRGNYKRLTTATVYVVCAVTFLALLVNWPGKVSGFFDGVVRSAAATAYGEAVVTDGSASAGPAAADDLIGGLYASASYRTWCWGMVGTNSTVGSKYCPDLWRATHLSYTEAALPTDRRGSLMEGKADDFKKKAEELRKEYPESYVVLQGKNGVTRGAAAGLSAALWILLSFYPLWGLGMVFASVLMLRLAVALAPVLGPIFLHPAMARSSKAMGNVLFGAVVNAILFSFATAVYLGLAGVLVDGSGGVGMPLALVLLVILTWAMWKLTKPWRRLTGFSNDIAHVVERGGNRPAAGQAPDWEAPESRGRPVDSGREGRSGASSGRRSLRAEHDFPVAETGAYSAHPWQASAHGRERPPGAGRGGRDEVTFVPSDRVDAPAGSGRAIGTGAAALEAGTQDRSPRAPGEGPRAIEAGPGRADEPSHEAPATYRRPVAGRSDGDEPAYSRDDGERPA
jgi:hypothetical protein